MRLSVGVLLAMSVAFAATSARAQTGPSHVIPPKQESVIDRMLGDADTAACARTGRVIEPEAIAVDYRCRGATVRVALAHASANRGVVTAQFSVSSDADTAAARALVAEVAARVRVAEAEFRWITPDQGVRRGPPTGARSPPAWTGDEPERVDAATVAPDHHGRARDRGHWIGGAVLLLGACAFGGWIVTRRRGAARSARE